MNIKELRAKREGVLAAMAALETKGNTEALTEAEDADFEKLQGEQAQLAAAIRRSDSMGAANALSAVPVQRLTSPEGPAAPVIPGVEGLGEVPQPDMASTPTAKLLGGLRLTKETCYPGPNGRMEAYCAGKFALAVHGSQSARDFCKDNGLMAAAQQEGDNTLGGIFVLPQFMAQAMIDLRDSFGVFRANTNVRPMSSDVQIIPRFLSSSTAFFVGENTEVTESNIKFDGVSMTAKKLAVLIKSSNELLDDSVIDIGEQITRDMAFVTAKKEDQCGFIGTGTSTFGGITGATIRLAETAAGASVVNTAGGSLAYADFILGEFEEMVGKVRQYAIDGGNVKWYISRVGWAASILRLQNAAGGNSGGDLSGGMPQMFMGFPIVLVDVMDSVLTDTANTMKCMLGDLRMASSLGDRRTFGLKVSDQRYFELDQIGFLGISRFDINVHDTGTASESGPLIGLETPGS